MSSHDPFDYLKHKLWLKEGLGAKLPIWLPTTKSQKSPEFTCVQVACVEDYDVDVRNIDNGVVDIKNNVVDKCCKQSKT